MLLPGRSLRSEGRTAAQQWEHCWSQSSSPQRETDRATEPMEPWSTSLHRTCPQAGAPPIGEDINPGVGERKGARRLPGRTRHGASVWNLREEATENEEAQQQEVLKNRKWYLGRKVSSVPISLATVHKAQGLLQPLLCSLPHSLHSQSLLIISKHLSTCRPLHPHKPT